MVSFSGIFLIMFLHYGLAVQPDGTDIQQCLNDPELTNGCSIPGRISFPYEEFFLPACTRHDLCYSCGFKYSFERVDCDNGFRRNMKDLCYLKERSKVNQMTLMSFSFGGWQDLWNELKGTFLVGKDLTKWLSLKTGTHEHCLNGVDVYYDAVRHFSMKHFHEEQIQQCNWACAKTLSNPTIPLNETKTYENVNPLVNAL